MTTSQRRRLGVEEELLVFDRQTWQTAPGFDALAEETSGRRSESVEHELKQEQVEIASAPYHDLDDVASDLSRWRSMLQRAAQVRGLAVAASATAPVRTRTTRTSNPRYRRMSQRFGLIENQQLTCGMHVHVAVQSAAEGVAVIDRIRPWLPLLVALSGNSPYWQGQDTAHSSYRTVVWGQWPTSGPTELFGDIDGYRAAVTDLLASGSILDEGMVYFGARLSRNYPTVEIRVADVCTDLSHAVAIAGLARAMADTARADAARGIAPLAIRVDLLQAAMWSAARFGVSDTLLDPVLRRARAAADVVDNALDALRPALKANGDLERIETALGEILREGNGADRQRAVMREVDQLEAVVEDLARRTAPEAV